MSKLKFVRQHFFWFLLGAFALFVVFFSDHSLLRLLGYKQQERALERDISAYRDSIFRYERYIEEVSGDSRELERYAREKLNMKRANEDVFIIK